MSGTSINTPTTVASFVMDIESVEGVSTQVNIILDPTFTSRTYTFEASASLIAQTFAAIPDFTVTDSGTEQILRDLNAANARAFYRTQIEINR